jgi:multidrug efflux pump
VRVELNPRRCSNTASASRTCAPALASANANSPKGAIEEGDRRYQIYTNDQASHAADYQAAGHRLPQRRRGALSDVADVEDSVEDLRNDGLANGEPFGARDPLRQPGANIIDTVDQVKAELPQLQAALPSDVNVTIASTAARRSAPRCRHRNGRWCSRCCS